MANIETDAAGRPIAYDSAGRPIVTDTVHGRPVTVDGYPADRVATTPVETVVRDRTTNGGWLIALLIIVALVVAAFALKLINIDQISGGSAPKVSVTGGALPKFKVDTAKVDVGTTKTEVTTPTVNVGTTKTEVTTPTLSVEKADAADKPQ